MSSDRRNEYRLNTGGRIDRSRPLSFTFNGKRYTGYAGDTLASALLANNVLLVSRSFKLHRPRGIVGAGAGELIGEAVLAIEMGCQVYDVTESIHPHPTLSETLMFAGEVHFGTATEIYKPKRTKK